jgi:hypothetical protein
VLLLLLLAVAARAQSIEQEKLTTVKIYLLDTFEQELPLKLINLTAVERKVKTASVLRSTLEVLLIGATDEETSQNLRSPIVGIELVSVRQVKNTVFANFRNTGTNALDNISALIFKQSVEKTARQFYAVKKVEICLDGVLNFWSKTLPRKCK